MRDQRRRLRLAHVDGPRRGDGGDAARPDPVEQVHPRGLDDGRCRLLLRALPGAARRCGVRRPEPGHGAALSPPRHRSRARTAVVFATPDEPGWLFDPEVSEDGRLLVLTIERGTDPETRIFVADLADGVERATVRPLLDAADAHYEHVATIGRRAILRTNREAPLSRVIAVDVDDPSRVARGRPGGRRRPGARHAGRRPAGLCLPPRCPPPPRDLRARRAVRDGRRPARDRHGRRPRRSPRGPRAVPRIRELPRPVHRARGPHGGRRRAATSASATWRGIRTTSSRSRCS